MCIVFIVFDPSVVPQCNTFCITHLTPIIDHKQQACPIRLWHLNRLFVLFAAQFCGVLCFARFQHVSEFARVLFVWVFFFSFRAFVFVSQPFNRQGSFCGKYKTEQHEHEEQARDRLHISTSSARCPAVKHSLSGSRFACSRTENRQLLTDSENS